MYKYLIETKQWNSSFCFSFIYNWEGTVLLQVLTVSHNIKKMCQHLRWIGGVG